MKKLGPVFLVILLAGCPGSPAWKSMQHVPQEANIKIVTHPKLIEGLEFIDGFSIEFPGMFSSSEKENLVRYSVYERGYRNVTVLMEIKEQGDRGTWVNGGNGTMGGFVGVDDGWALITICKDK